MNIRALPKAVAAAAIGFYMSGSAWADVVKYADFDVETSPRAQALINDYIPLVNEKTGGAITIQPFFNAVLGGGGDQLRLVRDGVAEAAGVWAGYFPTEFPAQSVLATFPAGPLKYENQIWFYHQFYDLPEVKAELDAANHKVLMFGPWLHLGFMSKYPVTELADFKDHKWRAGSRWLLGLLEQQGANPVSVPWGDTYTALQTGLIEGVVANYDGVHNMRFWEPAPNVFISSGAWQPNPYTYTVSKSYWDGLSAEVQEGWIEASKEFEAMYREVLVGQRDEIMAIQRDAGVKITEMSEDDLARWSDAETAAIVQAEWVEVAKGAGLTNAEEFLAKALALLEEAKARD